MPANRFSFDDSDFVADTRLAVLHPPTTIQDDFTGTSGNDTFTGTTGDDTFDLSQGGNDTASGLDGDDTFVMGAALNAADRLDGGTGSDTVKLAGDYSAGLIFTATTMINVETLYLAAGSSYKLTTDDATVASGAILLVNGTHLNSGDVLTFNGAAETDGRFHLDGGAGADVLIGGRGNDTISGGDGNDKLNLSAGGNDAASGGDGNDIFTMGAAFSAADKIDGGDGSDTVVLDGDYSAGIVFNATTMVNVEEIKLTAGHNYSLTTTDATVAAGQILTVNGSGLGISDRLTFNGSAETDGTFHVSGGADDDFFFMGAAMTAADRINGGGNSFLGNQISLDGDYTGAHSLTLAAATIANIQEIVLSGGHSYALTTNDGNVAASQQLEIDASQLGASNAFTFNGAAETDGMFDIVDGAGNDVMTGGAGADTFDMWNGGNDNVKGGAGADSFNFAGTLTTSDRIDGGAGSDVLQIAGEYTGSHAIVFGARTMVNVESIDLQPGYNYTLTTNDATVGAGDTLVIDGHLLKPGNILTFDGSAETDGSFVINGGAGNDFLIGGAVTNTLIGAGGADELEGGAGPDVFFYSNVSDSTGPTYDTIVNFDAGKDMFAVPVVPTTISGTVTSGALSQATFDSDLAAAVNSTFLQAHQAEFFTPDSGDLAGETFLVVDENGSPGYQAGQDFVFHFLNTSQIGTLSAANFESDVI